MTKITIDMKVGDLIYCKTTGSIFVCTEEEILFAKKYNTPFYLIPTELQEPLKKFIDKLTKEGD